MITSLGVYCYNSSLNVIYLFLTIFILFLKVIDFKLFSYHQLFYEFLNKNVQIYKENYGKKKKHQVKENILAIFLKNFMDDRARTVDTVCLLLFFDINFKYIYLSKIIFGLYAIKSLLMFLAILYVYYYQDRLKKEIK